MTLLVFESWILLLYCGTVLRLSGFEKLHRIIRNRKVQDVPARVSTADLCHAADLACVFYFRQVMCLQRSSATTLLLRRKGWEAEMVIGAQVVPFKSHAWVEVKGAVVNDKPYMPDIYEVIARC